jgi:hypothetical protein
MGGEHLPLMSGAQPAPATRAVPPADTHEEGRVAQAVASLAPGVNGMALGLTGAATVWHCVRNHLVEPGSFEYEPIITWVLIVPAALLILLYASKAFLSPLIAEQELSSAAGNSSLATASMATMSIAFLLHREGLDMPSKILWYIAVLAHITFLIIFTMRHLRFLHKQAPNEPAREAQHRESTRGAAPPHSYHSTSPAPVSTPGRKRWRR